jgi:GGDEF domain-containing protein
VLIAFSLSWLIAVAWGLKRMWRRALPWVSWLLAGFVFIYAGFVLYAVFLPQLVRWTNWTIEQAHEFWVSFHITLYCLCTYIGLVWRSRLISESRLRAGSYETVDPLTGCMTPLAFELAVKQSAQRSYSLGYRSAVLLIKNANHEIFTKTFSSDNPELGVLMTSELVRRNCRSHDAVCRMKDNVFVVLMDGVQNAAFLKLQASKILAASLRLQRPHAPDEAMKLQIFGTFLPTEQQNIAHWLSRLIEEWGKAKHDASGTAIVVRESLNRSSIPGVSHE